MNDDDIAYLEKAFELGLTVFIRDMDNKFDRVRAFGIHEDEPVVYTDSHPWHCIALYAVGLEDVLVTTGNLAPWRNLEGAERNITNTPT